MSDNDTKNPMDSEWEELELTMACVGEITREFVNRTSRLRMDNAEIAMISAELQRLGGGGGRSGSSSTAGRGDSALEAALQEIEQSLARKKALGKQLCEAAASFAQELVRWAEDLERREQQQQGSALLAAPSVSILTAGNGLLPDEFGGLEGRFPVFVVSKLYDLTRIMQEKYGGLNNVAQLAVLKYIGEEYSGRGPWDVIQDWLADTGYGRVLLGPCDPVTGLPSYGIPESYRTGNAFQKAWTQTDFMDYDLGIANVNLKSAALLSGITSQNNILALAKYLTTDIGTIEYAIRFVKQAQDALSPLISGMDTETQAQLIVDFVREGPDKFWNRVKTKNGINDEELNAWKHAPNTYRRPDGTFSIPPEPNPKNFKRAEYGQIKKALGW